MKFNEMSSLEMENLVKGVKVNNSKGGGKKGELLEILKSGIFSVKECSIKMGISGRNVSSVLCYLRDDGYEIRKIGRVEGDGLVIWSKIVGGEKVGNRMELGSGSIVRFNFEEGCFDDEVEVKKDDVKKKK